MQTHDEIYKKLTLAASGGLGRQELIEVERHALTCEECRRELDRLRCYIDALRNLPEPPIPPGLVQRTQALVVQRREAAASRRMHDAILILLALFSWAIGAATWIVVRVFLSGGAAVVHANLGDAVAWSLGSTLLVWTTAGAAGMLLRKEASVVRRSL